MATLQELEAELRQFFQKQNYVEAMDIYEEIERIAGGLKPQHLVGRAQCHIKLRRKQDAKNDLMRAHQIDPGFQPTLHMLNENFPGWDQGAPPRPAQAPQPEYQHPPAAPAYQQAPQQAYQQPAPQQTYQPSAYQQPAPSYQQPAHNPAPAFAQTGSETSPPWAPATAPQRPAPPPQPQAYAQTHAPAPGPQAQPQQAAAMARVNWKFVMDDLQLARAARASH